jgi:hypothetical protein
VTPDEDIPPPPPPAPPAGASRYGWLVGVVVVLIMAYIAINTIRTNSPGAYGLKPGTVLPPFAAPLVGSGIDKDVDLARRPHSGRTGNVAACALRLRGVVNSCSLTRDAPAVIGFYFTRGANCGPELDAMQRLGARTPGVRFLGVIVEEDASGAAKIARDHHWTLPLAFDRDGGLSNVYGVAGCPTVVLAYPGGAIRETLLGGDRAVKGLERHVRALVTASVKRGWKSPV